jgi:hypothetical protein
MWDSSPYFSCLSVMLICPVTALEDLSNEDQEHFIGRPASKGSDPPTVEVEELAKEQS